MTLEIDTIEEGGAGVSDHGTLTGLADDDHLQYHTDVRGDARYWPLSTDLATQAELDAHINDPVAAHPASAVSYAGPLGAATDVEGALDERAPFKFARKTLVQGVTNSTVLLDDNALFVALPANSTWLFELRLIYAGPTNADIKVWMVPPSLPSDQLSWSIHPDWSATEGFESSAFFDPSSAAPVLGAAGTGVKRIALIKGMVRVQANAGNLKLMWAQNASQSTGTYVQVDSYLVAHRVA